MRNLLLLVIAIAVTSTTVSAQTQAWPLAITQINVGWSVDQFGLIVNSAISNPAGCAIADSYVVDSTSPGYKTYYSAALLAFGTSKNVTVVISNTVCTSSRPSIIGMAVFR